RSSRRDRRLAHAPRSSRPPHGRPNQRDTAGADRQAHHDQCQRGRIVQQVLGVDTRDKERAEAGQQQEDADDNRQRLEAAVALLRRRGPPGKDRLAHGNRSPGALSASAARVRRTAPQIVRPQIVQPTAEHTSANMPIERSSASWPNSDTKPNGVKYSEHRPVGSASSASSTTARTFFPVEVTGAPPSPRRPSGVP